MTTPHVRFCFDSHGRRDHYHAAIRDHSDPVIAHLPSADYGDDPDPDALNVRWFRRVPGDYDVFAPHGIADKGYRRRRFIDDFPFVCVSGPTWRAMYVREGMEPGKLLLVGYPKVDTLLAMTPRPRGDRPRLLWAPTVRTPRKPRSSWPELAPYLDALSDRYEIVVSSHPRQSRGGSTTQALVDADVVVSDTGSLLYEAWALDKPVVFPHWLVRESVDRWMRQTLEQRIYHERIGYHAMTPDELPLRIAEALAGGITARETAFIEGILPRALRGVSGAVMAGELLRVHDEALARRGRAVAHA